MVASRGVECSTLGGLGPRLRASFLSYADLGKSEFPPIGKTHGSRFFGCLCSAFLATGKCGICVVDPRELRRPVETGRGRGAQSEVIQGAHGLVPVQNKYTASLKSSVQTCPGRREMATEGDIVKRPLQMERTLSVPGASPELCLLSFPQLSNSWCHRVTSPSLLFSE